MQLFDFLDATESGVMAGAKSAETYQGEPRSLFDFLDGLGTGGVVVCETAAEPGFSLTRHLDRVIFAAYARMVLSIVFIIVAAVFGWLFYRELFSAQSEVNAYEVLRFAHTRIEPGRNYIIEIESIGDYVIEGFAGDEGGETPHDRVLVDFDALLSINRDTVGWLSIPGTDISYPVVQCADNNKYLSTAFDGSHSNVGSLFVDTRNNMKELDSAMFIYGHNMGAGLSGMFTELGSYLEQGFFDEHGYIQFDTAYGKGGFWRVVAAAHVGKPDGFPYDCVPIFGDDTQAAAWYAQVRSIAEISLPYDAGWSDNFLVLSTCNRSTFGISGRTLVFAVLIGH